ncbi:DUF6308 family protein [Demequina iriomotensis]|uniref:DUF6308 family protein n=1 Tax=Demequina iriomotensis TaxID=1536641 RepID=UPI00078125AF|nr:DUF6308 family protein [Demequina iriomotensis]
MAEALTVGGITIPFSIARTWVREYTDPSRRDGSKPFAFPAYDTFEVDSDPNRLSDGELMAPGLLNVPVKMRAYYALQDMRPALEEALGAIKPDADLAKVKSAKVRVLTASIYAVLDDRQFQGRGVRRTTLSKVLHRKRPAFIPLHDVRVNRCYFGDNGVIESDASRTWADSMAEFSIAVARDLRAQREAFAELAAVALSGPRLTHLRVLDIIAWKANGKSLSPTDGET